MKTQRLPTPLYSPFILIFVLIYNLGLMASGIPAPDFIWIIGLIFPFVLLLEMGYYSSKKPSASPDEEKKIRKALRIGAGLLISYISLFAILLFLYPRAIVEKILDAQFWSVFFLILVIFVFAFRTIYWGYLGLRGKKFEW